MARYRRHDIALLEQPFKILRSICAALHYIFVSALRCCQGLQLKKRQCSGAPVYASPVKVGPEQDSSILHSV